MGAAPHSPEAERTVLGAIIVENAALASAVPILKPKDFYREAHRAIYGAMLALWEQGKAIDLLTLTNELTRTGLLQAVGGAAYVASLVDGMPRVASVEEWCGIVKERAALRTVAIAASRMLTETERPGAEAKAVLEKTQQIMQQTLEETTRVSFKAPEQGVKEALVVVEEMAAGAAEGRAVGLTTGYVDLDRKLTMQPGDFVIVGARPSMGKSSLLVNLGDNMSARGDVVAMFSAEMPARQVNVRRLCAEARVPLGFFKGEVEPRGDEWERVAAAASAMVKRRFYIDDTANPTPLEMKAKARYLKALRSLDVVLIDYLQFVSAGQGKKNETREQEVARISRGLKQMARELGVVVVAAAQIKREVEHRKDPRPTLADLRESGAMEADADSVLFLHRDRMDDEERSLSEEAEVIISKQRNGPTGLITLRFDGGLTRFDNLAREV